MICKSHEEPINFICCQSEWHFEYLCTKCIVPHNEFHSKNRSLPVIKDF